MNRQTAIAKGQQFYFTGKSCKRGHIALRYVANFNCVICFKLRDSSEKRRKQKRKIAAKWRKENPDRNRATIKAWQQNNPERYKLNRRRQEAKFRAGPACPPWADFEKIAKVYKRAADRGLEVDHVIPLQHRRVCGLHVHNNLQLLTTSQNRRKRNAFR